MAHQINPLTPLVTEEIKEINKEDYKESFELSQVEVSRLRSEVKELVLKLEKITKKLDKKKGELETEKTNSNTLRQLIQELNNKLQLLERTAPLSPVSPSVNPAQTAINEEFVEKLMTEKSGLESQVYEQKREIEHLNSELMSCKKGLTQQTESRHQEYALNREVTQLRTDLALKEQQLEECQSNFLKLEAECKLGKQLFQEALSSLSAEKEHLLQLLDKERGVKEKLGLETEQLNNQIAIQRTDLAEQFARKEDTLGANEDILLMQINEKLSSELSELKHSNSVVKEGQFDSLMSENSKLQDTNKQLSEDLSKLEIERKARIEELMETKSKQQQTIDNNNNKRLNELQEKDKSINKLAKEMETMRTDFGKEEQQTKEFDNFKAQIKGLENENVQKQKSINTLMVQENKQKIASKQYQQEKEKSQFMIETKNEQISELKRQFVNQQTKQEKYQTQMETQLSALNTESERWRFDYSKFKSLIKVDKENGELIANLKTELETVKNKLEVKINSSDLQKQLINKLYSDIEKLEKKIAGLGRQLTETEEARTELELKYQSKEKHHTTSGATSLTIISEKPFKILFRPDVYLSVVRLKSLANPSEYNDRHVICSVNNWYQIGVLVGIYDMPTNFVFTTVTLKYAGIRFTTPIGYCNGEFCGKRYFDCETDCGVFVQFEDVYVSDI